MAGMPAERGIDIADDMYGRVGARTGFLFRPARALPGLALRVRLRRTARSPLASGGAMRSASRPPATEDQAFSLRVTVPHASV
jgi:hypothetical protein